VDIAQSVAGRGELVGGPHPKKIKAKKMADGPLATVRHISFSVF